MTDTLTQEIDEIFKGKPFLTLGDVSQLLGCDVQIVHNWTRRSDPRKRPPRIMVGKELRFPRREFVRWLVTEQLSSGE